MTSREQQRKTLLERMADHLVAHGLRSASLRPLAAAAGTSDRMLLYYFTDKDELLAATLMVVAQRLQAMLDHIRLQPRPYHQLLPQVAGLLTAPTVRPYMNLWWELAALAARDEEPFHTIARGICDGFLHWTAAALQVDSEEQRLPLAALLLATVDGYVLMHSVGCAATGETALQGAALQV